MHQIDSVLVADEIEQECLDILKNNGIKAVKRIKLSEEQLCTELVNYDAVIVRSATKITKKIIQTTAGKLKLIGRAGTGVDNIDVTAATEHGILVMNTPTGNSRSAAELTCTLILSLARRISEADRSMKGNKWNRKALMGEEVFGKTLAVIGLGRIGMGVAQRLQAFGMKTVGYDPFVSPEDAEKAGISWVPLNEIWSVADYITIHVPLTPKTKNLINSQSLKACKSGVKIINVARGGIVNEKDLLDALNDGHVAGAALDVYEQEPPTYRSIIEHPRVICTPHLGASTAEAQRRVAEEIAENIVALNTENKYLGVVIIREVIKLYCLIRFKSNNTNLRII
uniref:D-3-phosphoglycerate dehydrogenase n=1 Tax=Syphacia muris TaxID=451379 RepID=A0A0N5AN17_9BILA